MTIRKNPLNETIISVNDLKKEVIIYIYKNGTKIMDFSFNNIKKYNSSISFYNGNSFPVNMTTKSIRGKLKFDFQTEDSKFYKLEI